MNDTSSQTPSAVLDARPATACADSVATAVTRHLYAAGLPIAPERAARFSDALILMGPVSHSRLYFAARTVFVSHPAQLPAFERAFSSFLDSNSAALR